MRFVTKFAIALIGWNFLPPADVPAQRRASPLSFTCTVASVYDGDTLRCVERGIDGRQIRVRISGIDARELDGTCAPGHPCASAPPQDATAALERLVDGQRLQCQFEGFSYGREAAFCRNGAGVDISCAMIKSRTVALCPRYWRNHRC